MPVASSHCATAAAVASTAVSPCLTRACAGMGTLKGAARLPEPVPLPAPAPPRAPARALHVCNLPCNLHVCRAYRAHAPLAPRPGAGPTAHAGPQGAQASAAPWETWWLRERPSTLTNRQLSCVLLYWAVKPCNVENIIIYIWFHTLHD